MKKNLKRNFKRWIAFLLAVVLIATTCVYSSDAHLRAEGEDTEVESQSEPANEEVEMTPTEVGDSNEDPQPEVEETYEEEPEEVVETPSEEPAQGSEETTTTPEELPENPETTPAESADPSVSPSVDPTIDPSASPSASPSATPSASPEKEAEETYSYTICYYYDGVEDEDARVEKEDGVPGEKILVSVKVKDEVTFGGKNYKLDKIENKDGEITEDVDENVVSIYYVLIDEKKDSKENKSHQTLTATADDGARVKVVGVLPEGAQVKVETVSVTSSAWDAVEKSAKNEGKELIDLKLYDITIWDADGNEIQPDDTVKVTITGADVKDGDAAVYHVEDGNAEKVADVASGNNAQFDAEHFSVYGISSFFKTYGVGVSALTEKDKNNELKIKLFKTTEEAFIKHIDYEYSIGETIRYYVQVQNTSQSDDYYEKPALKNIHIIDTIFEGKGTITFVGAGWIDYNTWEFKLDESSEARYENGEFVIETLAYEGTIWLAYDYKVDDEDAGKTITNTVYLSDENEDILLEDGPGVMDVKIKEPETFRVTYVLDGGTVEKYTGNGDYDQEKGEIVFEVPAGAVTPKIPDPVKDGDTFEKWDKEIAETVTEDVIYTAIYKRNTDEFIVNGCEVEYDTDQHQVNVEKIKPKLKDGERIQYQYNGEWLDASKMENYWPSEVGELKVPVRVVDENDTVIWKTEEEAHPSVVITRRSVKIKVPDVTREYSRSNDYDFGEENQKIVYTYGTLSGELDNKINNELSFIKELQIERTEKNKDENDITTYEDALELGMSEADLNSQYKNFSFNVEKGDFTITVKGDTAALKVKLTSQTGSDGVTYDGEDHFVTIEVTLDGDVLSKEAAEEQGVEFSYTTNDDYISEAQKNVVNKLVQVTASKKGYQDAKSDPVVVKINPKKVTVTAKNATAVLGREGINYSGELTVEGLIKDDAIGVAENDVNKIFTCVLKDGIHHENVGEIKDAITLTYDLASINPNYTIELVSGDLDVQGTVTYDANDSVPGSLNGNVPEDPNAYSHGSSITVTIPGKDAFKKDGATFLGWINGRKEPLVTQESNVPSGMLTSDNARLYMGNQNITLYAVWAKDVNNDNIPDYEQNQIIYDLNGGNGDSANPKPEDPKYYNVGDTATLVSYGSEGAVKPTKDKAVFIGWSKNSSVEGQVYANDPAEFINETVTFETAGDITVYAVWAKDEKGPEGGFDKIADYLEHAVTYTDSRFGVKAPVDNNLYPEGYVVTLKEGLSEPSNKQEYQLISFDSWKNDNVEFLTDETGKSTFTMPDEAVTFDAQWKYLTIGKKVTPKEGGYKVGEDMLFTITVKNEGDVDLTGITVSEDLDGAKLVDGNESVEQITFDLPKNESKELEAKYEVKDSDVKNSSLTNIATASIGSDTAIATVNGVSDLDSAGAALKVTKEIMNLQDSYAVGEPIRFKVTVENAGSVTVKGITVTDAFEEAKVESANFFARMVNKVREWVTGWEGTNTSGPFDLKPGKTKELIVTYIVQEADLGHSGYWNVATATGKSAIDDSEVTESAPSDAITVADAEQKVSLQKQVVKPSDSQLEEGKYPVESDVQYRVTVRNDGNTTLKDFVINDQMTYADGKSVVIPDGAVKNIDITTGNKTTVNWNGSGFTIGTLARNDTLTFTYTYTVQKNDAGKTIYNAVVPAEGIEGEEGSSDPVTVVEKELSVEKEVTSEPASNDGKYALGEKVTYKVTITNKGNVTLKDVHVDDQFKDFEYGASLEEGETNDISSLTAGNSVTLHYTYQIQEKDLGKKIANIATATANDGTKGENPEDQAVITMEDPEPQASIEKEIVSIESGGAVSDYSEGDMVKVGDTITYRITVTNTGNTTLKAISISDQMEGKGTIDSVSGATYDSEKGIFTIGTIEPNQERNASRIITYSYKVDERDKGLTIKNTAQIDGEIKDENGDISRDEKDVTVEDPSVEVTKEIEGIVRDGVLIPASESDKYSTGDIVQFKVTVKNIGNVDLSGIEVTDTMTGAQDAEGKGPEAVFVPTDGAPSQTIDLKQEEFKILTYQYTVRSVDIDEKETPTNAATATFSKRSSQVVVPLIDQEPAYEVEKKLHNSIEGIYAGEEIEYDILVTNTGNTTLSNIVIDDEMSYVDAEGTPLGTIYVTSDNADWAEGQFILREPLAWGQNVLIQYTYTIAEDDAGKTIRNIAYGKDREGKEQPASSEDVTIEKKSLNVEKSVITKKDKYALGEAIEFEVIVENIGNVPLSDIVVEDSMINAAAEAQFVECSGATFEDGKITELAPNSEAILTYQYTIEENDLGKRLGNEVRAYVKTDPTIEGDDVVGGLHAADPEAKAFLTKTITSNGTGTDGKYKLNDEISYQIIVENTGNTTLENVVVKDTMTGAASEMYATNVSGATIKSAIKTDNGWEYEFEIDQPILPKDPSKPNQSNIATILCTYRIKEADLDKTIGNIATVNNDDIIKEDPENPNPIEVEKKELTVEKTARDPQDGESYKLNETVTFDIKITNTGNVPLSGIEVTDTMIGVVRPELGRLIGQSSGISLNPEDYVTLTYEYVVQPGDITSQTAIKNTVTAIADDDDETTGYGETEKLEIDGQHPSFTLNKSVISTGSAEGGRYAVGDTIRYQIVVDNTGNVAWPSGMTVKDQMTGANGPISNMRAAITVGEPTDSDFSEGTVQWNDRAKMFILNGVIPIDGRATITYDYVVTAEDAGNTIKNTAGKFTDPGNRTTTSEVAERGLSISKRVIGGPQDGDAYVMGENILFEVTVKNTGNVTIDGITVTDQMQNAVGSAVRVDAQGNAVNADEPISLAADASTVLYYSYTVDRNDIELMESGSGKTIWNSVTVTGEDLDNPNTEENPDLTDETDPIQLDREYELTVIYQYADGSEAAPSRTVRYAYGQVFTDTMILSPDISGYTPNMRTVGIDTTKRMNSTVTITYVAIPAEPTPVPGEGGPTPDPEEPEGPDAPIPGATPIVPVPPVDEETVPVVPPVIIAAVPAAAGVELITVPDAQVPLDGVITQDDDGNVVIIPVEDMEVPLADRKIDDHKCCIMSFLLMLATLIIYSWFTHSMKKRQKKLAELKDQLAEETLKRQLGIADESSRR